MAWRFCHDSLRWATIIYLAFVDTLGFHAPNPAELPFILDELPLVRAVLERALRSSIAAILVVWTTQ